MILTPPTKALCLKGACMMCLSFLENCPFLFARELCADVSNTLLNVEDTVKTNYEILI